MPKSGQVNRTAKTSGSLLWVVPAVAATVFVIALASVHLLKNAQTPTTIWWPAAGIGLAVIARTRRAWWYALVPAVGAAVFASAVLAAHSLSWSAVAFGVANASECLIGALILRGRRSRDLPGTDLPRPVLLNSVPDAMRLVAAIGLGVPFATAVVALRDYLQGSHLLWTMSRAFAVNHALGILMMIPLLLIPGRSGLRAELMNRSRNTEWLLQLAVSGGVAFSFYDLVPNFPLSSSMIIYPLIWGAARLGALRAMISVLTTATVVTVSTLRGHGRLSTVQDLTQRGWMLQLLLLSLCVVSLAMVLGAQSRRRVNVELARRSDELAEAQHFASLGSWSWDVVTDQTRWSSEVFAIVGHDEATFTPFVGCLLDLVDAEHWDVLQTVTQAAILNGESWEVEYVLTRPDGVERIIFDRGGAEYVDGTVVRLAGVLQDVTESRRAAQELAEARDHIADMLDAATEQAIIGTDLEGRVTVFNVGAQRMLGYTEEEMLGRTPVMLHDHDEVVARAAELGVPVGLDVMTAHQRRTGLAESRRWTFVTSTGERLQVMLTITMIRDDAGEPRGFIGIAADVTEQVKAERALAMSEQRFRLAFATAPVGMAIVDLADHDFGRMLQVNPAMSELSGLTEQELLSRTLQQISHPEDTYALASTLFQLRASDEASTKVERRLVRNDGRTVWVQLGMSAVPTEDGSPYAICLIEDVTARKQAQQDLLYQSLHDPLTGLANRSLLRDRLDQALAATTRSGRPVGVLYVDLDGFKAVNDNAGHAAGDELLSQTADRLRQVVRPGDTVARLGGDEFAVVCVDIPDAARLNVIAQRVLAALRTPFELSTSVHRISASVGVSLSGEHSTAEQLLRTADDAMYEAKHGGKDQLAVWAAAS